MKTTMGLGWKTLVSKIHPPLPMTPQESQRLLALLNTSFMQQFDQHRPSNLEEHAGLHLQSILTNPLFSASPRSSHEATALSIPSGRSDKSTGLVREFVKRPMDILKERISAGTATFQTAKTCLQAEARNCLASSAATVGDAMRASNAGSIILDWLSASRAETLGTLLEQSQFFRLLLGFLVAEKRYDRMWSWLQILQSDLDVGHRPHSRISMRKTYNRLLLTFIKSEVSLGDGIDAATAIFVRAMYEALPNQEGVGTSSAWYLTRKFMRLHKPAPLNHTTIRAFMEAAGTSHKPNTLMSVCHWVYLAETQDLTVALRYLESLQPGKPSHDRKLNVSLMALEAARSLFKEGDFEVLRDVEARRENLRRKVGGFFPKPRFPQERLRTDEEIRTDEENNLRLLGGLATH